MSTTTLPVPAVSVQARAFAAALGVIGTAAVAATVAGYADAALLPLLAVSMLTGAVMVATDFGFTGGYRLLLGTGDGRPIAVSLLIPAIAALAIIPLSALGDGYGRYVTPIGLPLVGGAAMFGVGMQLANGCGSGALIAAATGSRRMAVALPFMAIGGVLGSLVLPAAARWPDMGTWDLLAWFGPWGGLLATEALLALFALALLRRVGLPQPERLRAGAMIGVLAAGIFLVSGSPWSITMGLTVTGAKAAGALGGDLSAAEFWLWDGPRQALHEPLLGMHGALADLGLLLGGVLAAASGGGLRHRVAIGWHGAAGAAAGGLLMGVGARLAAGCNIGAFVAGAASGSLHGFVWIAAALAGTWLGMRLRPLVGLSAH